MPSKSFLEWTTIRAKALDEIAHAHASVGGTRRGRRYATQQINQAYAVLLASHFQGFCRDLHTESVRYLVASISRDPDIVHIVQGRFTQGRQLDSGNAQPGSIGSDFGRLGVQFWNEVQNHHRINVARQAELENLNRWRNAIAHQDFAAVNIGFRTNLALARVRRWRRVCRGLARSFDEVMRLHLQMLTGMSPW